MLRGGGSQDTLRGADGVQGNDRLDGGTAGTVHGDPLDAMTSCNDKFPWPPIPTPTPREHLRRWTAPSRVLPTVAPER